MSNILPIAREGLGGGVMTDGEEIIVDNFAGGGGASMGIEQALGRPVDVAINHDPAAVHMHQMNHPHTRHFCENIFEVDPLHATGGRPVGLAWFSPDCTHHSRAKGGQPRSRKIRGLAWIVLRWAALARPRVIILENVQEFADWGPLTRRAKRPKRDRKGETFRRWLDQLRQLGYEVEYRTLNAADYGAPTHRKRLFLVARRDGLPIVWPEPTHGPGRANPYRTAAECIDWSLPVTSIFERRRPLAEATCRRIATGIVRYVLEDPQPFIIAIDHKSTIATENRHALVMSFLAKHYGGVIGHKLDRPIGTVTARDHHSIVVAHLTKFYGTNVGASPCEPLPTVTAGGKHLAEVRAFLIKYYGTAVGQDVSKPLGTVTSKHKFGLVTIRGEPWKIVDIGLRMLEPRELARAQGFHDDYLLIGSKANQIAMIGNSVSPPNAAAVVRVNMLQGEASGLSARGEG